MSYLIHAAAIIDVWTPATQNQNQTPEPARNVDVRAFVCMFVYYILLNNIMIYKFTMVKICYDCAAGKSL